MEMTESNSFDEACRLAEMIKAREANLGSYPGDGPTAEQADLLLREFVPLRRPSDSVLISDVWSAFRRSTELQASWVFPERDPIAGPMTQALIQIQNYTGGVLEGLDPEWKPKLEQFANLHVVANAAQRQTTLRGNNIDWRIALARVLNKLGAKRISVSLADQAVRRWRQ